MDSSVRILLDNYEGVCYPSQTIAGRVECYFNEEKTIRAIRIKFKGRAKTEWTRKQGKTRVTYKGEEIYFEEEYNLVAGEEDDFKLGAGKHTYPFSYILPQTLPSSFEGTYGNIRYYIKATVDRPWKFDYEEKLALNVVSFLDLNYLPGLREPLAESVDKDVCCCWCRSGPVTLDVSLPVTGCVPGQKLNIGAYVQNMSNVTAECVEFSIVKMLQFITHQPSTREKNEEDIITSCTEGAVGAHAEKSWTSSITVPTDADFPNLIPCSIINMTYRLVVKVVLPFPHTNLATEFPITIGTIPLSGINTDLPGPPPQISSGTYASGDTTYGFNDTITYPSVGRPYPLEGASALPSYNEAEQLNDGSRK